MENEVNLTVQVALDAAFIGRVPNPPGRRRNSWPAVLARLSQA
jgi:hypothetical protein